MNVYDYQRPVGKIDDIAELRNEFIAVYDQKTHKEVAVFCIEYGKRLLAMMGFGSIEVDAWQDAFDSESGGVGVYCSNVKIKKEVAAIAVASFFAIQEWIDGKVHYQKARSIGGVFNDIAREETDIIKARFYRTMAQISCIAHVKYHGLWACDFAVALINRIYPKDMEKVREERLKQIEILREI